MTRHAQKRSEKTLILYLWLIFGTETVQNNKCINNLIKNNDKIQQTLEKEENLISRVNILLDTYIQCKTTTTTIKITRHIKK